MDRFVSAEVCELVDRILNDLAELFGAETVVYYTG